MKRLAILAIVADGVAIWQATLGHWCTCSFLVVFAGVAMLLASDISELRRSRSA